YGNGFKRRFFISSITPEGIAKREKYRCWIQFMLSIFIFILKGKGFKYPASTIFKRDNLS
ncbi:MAG: hypothetical protein J7K81_01750, partial [Methanophagales archaeon]|nr:hypothetical protein [Methanophagales archaeon]